MKKKRSPPEGGDIRSLQEGIWNSQKGPGCPGWLETAMKVRNVLKGAGCKDGQDLSGNKLVRVDPPITKVVEVGQAAHQVIHQLLLLHAPFVFFIGRFELFLQEEIQVV